MRFWRFNARAVILAVVLVVAGVAYVTFVLSFGLQQVSFVENYGVPTVGNGSTRSIGVYVEALTIDPLNNTLRLRFNFTPDPSLQGRRLGTPKRNLTVRIGHGTSEQEFELRADQLITSQSVDTDLGGGSILDYPFDRFTARLIVEAFEDPPATDPDASPQRLKVGLALWEGLEGWSVQAIEAPEDGSGTVALQLSLRRTIAVRVLGLSFYTIMASIAIGAMTISWMVFLRRRKFEEGFVGALATMLFALPVMREGLPGSPLIGVRADLLIYLWAQVSVAMSLFLLIGTWARGESRTP